MKRRLEVLLLVALAAVWMAPWGAPPVERWVNPAAFLRFVSTTGSG